MNNVKVVHAKETIKTYNNFTEAATQKHPNGKYPERSKSTQHTRKKAPTSTCKSSKSQEAIILKSHVCIGALPRIHRISLEHPP